MLFRPFAAALAAVALVAAACKSDPQVPPADTFSGSYHLQSVKGNGLPYDYYCFGPSCEQLLGARLETMTQGRVRDIVVIRRSPTADAETDTVISTFAADGQRVVLSRSPTGGSGGLTYADTGEVDAAGRVLMQLHRLGGHVPKDAGPVFLYIKE